MFKNHLTILYKLLKIKQMNGRRLYKKLENFQIRFNSSRNNGILFPIVKIAFSSSFSHFLAHFLNLNSNSTLDNYISIENLKKSEINFTAQIVYQENESSHLIYLKKNVSGTQLEGFKIQGQTEIDIITCSWKKVIIENSRLE